MNKNFETMKLEELVKEYEQRRTKVKDLNDELKFLMKLIKQLSK
jgi:hypothetical protein